MIVFEGLGDASSFWVYSDVTQSRQIGGNAAARAEGCVDTNAVLLQHPDGTHLCWAGGFSTPYPTPRYTAGLTKKAADVEIARERAKAEADAAASAASSRRRGYATAFGVVTLVGLGLWVAMR